MSDLISAGYSNARGSAVGLQRVGDHLAVEIDEQHGVGADARAVIGEHRGDGAGVVRGDGFAKREVGGQHARRELELLGVLLEQAREHALADVELFFDLGVRVARIRGVHEPERGHLHQREQRHEEDDDAGLQALDAHQESARLSAHAVKVARRASRARTSSNSLRAGSGTSCARIDARSILRPARR